MYDYPVVRISQVVGGQQWRDTVMLIPREGRNANDPVTWTAYLNDVNGEVIITVTQHRDQDDVTRDNVIIERDLLHARRIVLRENEEDIARLINEFLDEALN